MAYVCSHSLLSRRFAYPQPNAHIPRSVALAQRTPRNVRDCELQLCCGDMRRVPTRRRRGRERCGVDVEERELPSPGWRQMMTDVALSRHYTALSTPRKVDIGLPACARPSAPGRAPAPACRCCRCRPRPGRRGRSAAAFRAPPGHLPEPVIESSYRAGSCGPRAPRDPRGAEERGDTIPARYTQHGAPGGIAELSHFSHFR